MICRCRRVARAVRNLLPMTTWAKSLLVVGQGMRPRRAILPTLRCRQERKCLAGAATVEIDFGRLLDSDRVHASKRRPASALFDQLRHRGRRPGNQNLDRAVEPVADPAIEAEPRGLPFGPHAKTNFLDDALDRQPFDLVRSDRHEEIAPPPPYPTPHAG